MVVTERLTISQSHAGQIRFRSCMRVLQTWAGQGRGTAVKETGLDRWHTGPTKAGQSCIGQGRAGQDIGSKDRSSTVEQSTQGQAKAELQPSPACNTEMTSHSPASYEC